mmetsp:Transcript_64223/g.153148  ORF Transcript_64223/g.153148 Transcript_64223/m.153148 type:complete len:276 (+) Transcript_64223:448-1275(+)
MSSGLDSSRSETPGEAAGHTGSDISSCSARAGPTDPPLASSTSTVRTSTPDGENATFFMPTRWPASNSAAECASPLELQAAGHAAAWASPVKTAAAARARANASTLAARARCSASSSAEELATGRPDDFCSSCTGCEKDALLRSTATPKSCANSSITSLMEIVLRLLLAAFLRRLLSFQGPTADGLRSFERSSAVESLSSSMVCTLPPEALKGRSMRCTVMPPLLDEYPFEGSGEDSNRDAVAFASNAFRRASSEENTTFLAALASIAAAMLGLD